MATPRYMPAVVNVSPVSQYNLMENGRRPPVTPPFRGVGATAARGPTINNVRNMKGLGNDPPNQTMVVTIRSPSLREYDYYPFIKGTSGVPMWSYLDTKSKSYFDDICVDLVNLNYRFELSTIKDQSLSQEEDYEARGTKKRKAPFMDPNNWRDDENWRDDNSTDYAAPGFASNWPRSVEGEDDEYFDPETIPVYDPVRQTAKHDAALWPAAPFREGRAVASSHFAPMGLTSTESTSWITDYGDISLDFSRKFRLSGYTVNVVNETGGGGMSESDLTSYREAAEQSRSFAMAVGGECDVKNLFSPSVVKGDRLFFVVAPTSVGLLGYNTMTPDGSRSPLPGVSGGECVQIRGVSSGDGFDYEHPINSEIPSVREQNARVHSYNGDFIGKNNLEPFAGEHSLDRDYVLSRRVIKNMGFYYEEDEFGVLTYKRNTDDILDLPESVMNIYAKGHVIHVGTVMYENRTKVPKDTVMEAHRSLPALTALPTVRVIAP